MGRCSVLPRVAGRAKGDFSGYMGARINEEHRLIYNVRNNAGEEVLEIVQCKNHY
jgi:Txe/YoeB family toxin of Txe-Axe toxin-antitoxin module